MEQKLFMGNEAIALGLVEQGCQVVTAYPGTPSSEILTYVVKHAKCLAREVYTEWSANEKIALETVLAASWAGVRAATAMKQVGLNIAADPLFSAAYTGIRGGLLIISADDPGPHSSQTEQDSRLMALTAKVPVLDPATPVEACAMVKDAFELSERLGLPVMLRPTTRLCHGRQSLPGKHPSPLEPYPSVKFHKDPARWAATPRFRYRLHVELEGKLRQLETEFAASSLNRVIDGNTGNGVAVIASGVAFQTARQVLLELGVQLPLLKIGTPYPLPRPLVEQFIAGREKVLVLEEPDACIELQLPDRSRVLGRLDGTVPAAGELLPEVVRDIVGGVLSQAGHAVDLTPADTELDALIDSLSLPVRKPRLCPGCPHRSTFFALKREFGADAILPGDIGCYTLGINLRAVDTCTNMGASVSMAHGFYQANRLIGDNRPIVATIGDSTFFHSGIPALINAVHTRSRFVLVILDNGVTAMTGFQPTAASSLLADGSNAVQISLEKVVLACGVGFARVVDPYRHQEMRDALRQAYEYSQMPEGGTAVVIAQHPCNRFDPSLLRETPIPVHVSEACDGCRYCLEAFECPALLLRADKSQVQIDVEICVACGQCVHACHKGLIVPERAKEQVAL